MSAPAAHVKGCSRDDVRTSIVLPTHDYCPTCKRMIERQEDHDDR